MISKFIISDENCYDIYLLVMSYRVESIENCIKEHKKRHFGEWNLETIELAIKEKFLVKKVIHCDMIYDLEKM